MTNLLKQGIIAPHSHSHPKTLHGKDKKLERFIVRTGSQNTEMGKVSEIIEYTRRRFLHREEGADPKIDKPK